MRFEAEHREVLAGDRLADLRLDLVVALDRRQRVARRRDRLQRPAGAGGAVARVAEVGVREGAELEVGGREVDVDQTLGLADRGLAQQDRVDEREDRGVGADPDRERSDRGEREARALAQSAQGIAQAEAAGAALATSRWSGQGRPSDRLVVRHCPLGRISSAKVPRVVDGALPSRFDPALQGRR